MCHGGYTCVGTPSRKHHVRYTRREYHRVNHLTFAISLMIYKLARSWVPHEDLMRTASETTAGVCWLFSLWRRQMGRGSEKRACTFETQTNNGVGGTRIYCPLLGFKERDQLPSGSLCYTSEPPRVPESTWRRRVFVTSIYTPGACLLELSGGDSESCS